jgi:hypothetical protein
VIKNRVQTSEIRLFVLGSKIMKNVLWILVLDLLWCNTVFSVKFLVEGQI